MEVAAVAVRLEGRAAAAAEIAVVEIAVVELVVVGPEEEGSVVIEAARVVIEAGLVGLQEGAASSTGGG